MENRVLLIIFIVLLFSCNQKNHAHEERVYYNKELLYVNQEYYENNSLKSRQTYKKVSSDSFIGHGYLYYHYPTGEIQYFTNVNEGKKIGTAYKYFKNGDIQEVLFYSPEGHAISAIKYDSLGNVIEEVERDQRKPQVIIKDLNVDTVKITVYTMDIPNNEKNIYLSTSKDGTIDSIIRTENQFDVFKVKKDTSMFEVSIDYINVKSGDIRESDYTQFLLDK